MTALISQPDAFNQWFGSFVTTPRHELDIASAEPPYEPEEVAAALAGGEELIRLSGLRVLQVGEGFFVNSEPLDVSHQAAAVSMCRYTRLTKTELGAAVEDDEFIRQLTALINQGYWYFED